MTFNKSELLKKLLKEKIHFLVGIICGGLKSKFFTEYLTETAGIAKEFYSKLGFTEKMWKELLSDPTAIG